MYHGSIVALVTPFNGNSVDLPALEKLVRFHRTHGTHGIVAVGTTGEASTLSRSEYRQVIETVVSLTDKQLPVIAGAGSNDPARAIEHTAIAADAGADAVLHAMGYYNRPSQEGIFQHFKQLSDTTTLPIIVYNVPPRTIIDIEPQTLARIASLEPVVGVKDASCDLSRPIQESNLIDKQSFCFLSGEDPTAVAYNAHGGKGCISVTANVAPALCSQLQESCASGDFSTALTLQRQLMPLHKALFQEPSPAGVKYACSLLSLCSASCRLPIVELSADTKTSIRNVMENLRLI